MNIKFSSGMPSDERSAAQIMRDLEEKIKDAKSIKEAINLLIGQDYIFAWTVIQNRFHLSKESLMKTICHYYDIPIPSFGNE